MNEGLIEHQLSEHEETLKAHTGRIELLERRGDTMDAKIGNLCDQIKNLVSTLKWGFGILVTITLFVLSYLITFKK